MRTGLEAGRGGELLQDALQLAPGRDDLGRRGCDVDQPRNLAKTVTVE